MKKTKFKNNYLFKGFGFPILLEKAEFHLIAGKWLLKVDLEKLSDLVIKALPLKNNGLTGSEVQFARTYFDLSKREFAKQLNVSHTAVNKWEESGQDKAKMDSSLEIFVRAYIKLKLKQEKDFADFYKHLIDEARHFSDESKSGPLSIAV